MKNLTDEQIMEAWRDGNIHAFDELYNRYKDMLFRYLLRQSSNQALAEEIFQEVWAALIKNRKNYTVRAKFKTYLFHIGHSKLIDYYRQSDKHSALSYEDNLDQFEQASDENKNPDIEADTGNKLKILMQHLSRLPAAQREIFLMHEESGMGLTEIAETMGISRDTAKSRLRYAVEKLRKSMSKYS